MINISQVVEDILQHDDTALPAAQKGWLNLSSYARSIRLRVQQTLMKDVGEASIVTALSRSVSKLPHVSELRANIIQSLGVHSNLVAITYERSEQGSAKIRDIYHQVVIDNKSFLTVTQGINEITIIAEASVAQVFRSSLEGTHKVYDKNNLIGITVKFALNNLESPNLIFALTRRLAYRDINIIEIVSTATELTYIIGKKDMTAALEQLQKDI
ncbi:MAG TPA: hypothetical protein VGS08_06190 [Candidatus Saccharimonadales bacterium]|nr:hypothetical protein [Candidatus Saccharimonadales bacterium]